MDITVENINIKFFKDDELLGEFEVKTDEEIEQITKTDDIKLYNRFEFLRSEVREFAKEDMSFKEDIFSTIKGTKKHLIGYLKSLAENKDLPKEKEDLPKEKEDLSKKSLKKVSNGKV